MRITFGLSSLPCSHSWSSLDTCNTTEIRSVSVPTTRAPRCANGEKRAARTGKNGGILPRELPSRAAVHARDSYRSVLLGLAEALSAGVTTVHNWAHNVRSRARTASAACQFPAKGARQDWRRGG